VRVERIGVDEGACLGIELERERITVASDQLGAEVAVVAHLAAGHDRAEISFVIPAQAVDEVGKVIVFDEALISMAMAGQDGRGPPRLEWPAHPGTLAAGRRVRREGKVN